MKVKIDFLSPAVNAVSSSNLNGSIEILSPAVSINKSFVLNAEIKSATQAYCELVADAAASMPEVIAASKNIEALLITDTASGAIASFTDGADGMPVKSCVVQIEPIQDLHGYGNPWPAGGGTNLLNMTVDSINEGQSYTASGTEGNITLESTANYGRCSYLINGLEVGQSYTFTAKVTHSAASGKTCTIYFNDANAWSNSYGTRSIGNTVSAEQTLTITITATSTILFIGYYLSAGSGYGDVITVKEARVVKGSSQGTWSPYSNICPISGRTGAVVKASGADMTDPHTTLNISFGQTVYGGTVEVVSGSGKKTLGKVKLSELSWNGYSSPSNGVFRAPIDGILCPNRQTPSSAISDALSAKAYAPITGSDYGRFAVTNDTGRLIIPTNGLYTTVPAFLAAMGDIEIVYPLATPSDISTTPATLETVLGDNNIFADTGDVSVEYRADIQLYINKVVAALA